LSLLGTVGYYGSYAFVIYETVAGALTIGALYFLTGAIARASTKYSGIAHLLDHRGSGAFRHRFAGIFLP